MIEFYKIEATFKVVGSQRSKRTITYYARGARELAMRLRSEFDHDASYMKIRKISEAEYVRGQGRAY